MRFTKLSDWLAWQETLHPTEIELGLDRIREVYDRFGPAKPPYAIITVAGTNGKGSCVAFLESILIAAGYKTGAYISPHLVHYNERIRINGKEVDDQTLCDAFARVDEARGDTSITYFEFGTLAALDIYNHAGLDIVILETGMGGRLDAVNIMDADVALITSIGIDHTDWLGHDRETISLEKAGIMRSAKPAIYGDLDPTLSLLKYADEHKVPLSLIARDFHYGWSDDDWSWCDFETKHEHMVKPFMTGDYQLQNASAALAALTKLPEKFSINREAIERGLQKASLPGRFQIVHEQPQWILDVAHNPHAAEVLAENLGAHPCTGKTYAVFGMLNDKDVEGVVTRMKDVIDEWHVCSLKVPRGIEAANLARVAGLEASNRHESVNDACRSIIPMLKKEDRVVVFGSFYTVSDVMRNVYYNQGT